MLHLAQFGLNWSINTEDAGTTVIPDDYKTKISVVSTLGSDYTVSRPDGTKHIYRKGTKLGAGTFGEVSECSLVDKVGGVAGPGDYIMKEMRFDDERDLKNSLRESIIQVIIAKETERSEYPEFNLKGPFAPRVYNFAYNAATDKVYIFAERMRKTVRDLVKGWEAGAESGRDVAVMLLRVAIVLSELFNKFGFNHRDFKSDNCMYIRDAAGNIMPRVIDFGFSCIKFNKLTINTNMRHFRYCSIGGRDMTQFIYEIAKYFPNVTKKFAPVARALLTFKRGDKVCDMLRGDCGIGRWGNTYDFVNTQSGQNPNGHPGVVRNVCNAFIKGEDWKARLLWPRPGTVHLPLPKVTKKRAPSKNPVPVVAKVVDSRKAKACPAEKPDYNPKTRRCVKSCPPGKTRGPGFKCVKAPLPALAVAPLPVHVPAVAPMKACPSAKPNYNPKTKRCVKACPSGQKRNSTFKCKRSSVRNTGAPPLAAPVVRKACPSEKPDYNPKTNRCVKPCPSGYKRDGSFKCVRAFAI
jgi:serine/threonine protein kinase